MHSDYLGDPPHKFQRDRLRFLITVTTPVRAFVLEATENEEYIAKLQSL